MISLYNIITESNHRSIYTILLQRVINLYNIIRKSYHRSIHSILLRKVITDQFNSITDSVFKFQWDYVRKSPLNPINMVEPQDKSSQ